MLAALLAFSQVVLIDIALSADNAIVIGLAVRGLPEEQRRRGIVYGIGAALVLRILFALIANGILQYSGIRVAGGLALLYISYKMFSEAIGKKQASDKEHAEPKTMGAAITQIVIADISMSVDNVLAVAGASGSHNVIMAFGLALSVLLMAFGAQLVSKYVDKYWWLEWAALLTVSFTGIQMAWGGFWATI